MIKKSQTVVFALALFFLAVTLSTSALAHSGRTDSQGGHYDGDEYHYHHGYPPHSHEDIDGDGEPDCPYDFVDATNHNGSTGSDSSRQHERGEPSQDGKKSEGFSFDFNGLLAWAKWISLSLLGFIAVVLCVTSVRERREKKLYTALYEGKTREEIASPPSGSSIGNDDLPCSAVNPNGKRWGDYTVFVSAKGSRYHGKQGCCGANTEVNAFTVRHFCACKRCKPQVPDMTWVEEYKEAMSKVDRYNIEIAN